MQKTVFVVSVFLFLGASFPLQAQSVATSSDADTRVASSLGRNWSRVAKDFPGNGAAQPVLLMDGSVIIQDFCLRDWYKLTPDRKGDYSNGSWRRIARLPDGYAPFAYASQVLADGRVVIAGGEYHGAGLNPQDCWKKVDVTSKAAIYDPVKDGWTPITAPRESMEIADAPSVVLPDTTFILGAQDSKQEGSLKANPILKLDLTEMAWKKVIPQLDWNYFNSETGWTLLQDGTLFAFPPAVSNLAFIYDPKKNKWSSGKRSPVVLTDATDDENGEVGPNLLRSDGKVVMFGVAASNDKGASTAIYDPATGNFQTGPEVPVKGFGLADTPAALLPSGDILFAASQGLNTKPTKFFRYIRSIKKQGDKTVDDDKISEIGTDAGTTGDSYTFLILPTGQVLATNGAREVKLFTDAKPENSPSWAPHITDLPNKSLTREKEYSVTGLRLNGVSEGAAVGDESQTSTNYPIFRLTEKYSKQVYYCRTTKVESRSIAPDAVTTAHFLVPKNVPASGAKNSYVLEVVANGVASDPVNVVLN